MYPSFNKKNYNSFKKDKYKGYFKSENAEFDKVIAEIGPNTPGGEYLRRYWHPIALQSELSNQPKAIKILGEDLILFKTPNEELGLVHKNCPHRNASLEYGKCEDRGIRCCYHGWLFSTDGEILETPGEDENSIQAKNIKKKLRLGAYPVLEFNEIIFAYFGPPEEMPEFPLYDSFFVESIKTRPYKINYNCNWIQILDAIMDPVHTSFLHSTISGAQFSKGLGEIGELEMYQRGIQFLGSNTRRVKDNIWVRVNELILPNFTQAGSAFAADGTKSKYFGRSSFTRWVVPIDDTHSMSIAWANFGERGDPIEYNTKEGCELIEQGELVDRTAEEKILKPADAEAVEGMGKISKHKNEHLMPTDEGIALYRRQIKKLIKELESGNKLPQPQQISKEAVRTYGQDTVLRIPQQDNDDRKFIKSIGRQVLQMQFDAEKLELKDRDKIVMDNLKELERELSTKSSYGNNK